MEEYKSPVLNLNIFGNLVVKAISISLYDATIIQRSTVIFLEPKSNIFFIVEAH